MEWAERATALGSCPVKTRAAASGVHWINPECRGFGLSHAFRVTTDGCLTARNSHLFSDELVTSRRRHIGLRGAPLQLVEELGSGSADQDEDPEFLHERILRFRIPGASSLPTRLDGLLATRARPVSQPAPETQPSQSEI